jgi:hypothetical protein
MFFFGIRACNFLQKYISVTFLICKFPFSSQFASQQYTSAAGFTKRITVVPNACAHLTTKEVGGVWAWDKQT